MATLRLRFLLPLLLVPCLAGAQIFPFIEPDTLVLENFSTDPTFDMLPFPTGDDQVWINFDEDEGPSYCSEGPPNEPGGWYWESDLGDSNLVVTNSCYTSCSYLDLPNNQAHNRNWLILKRIMIPDTSYFLCWRSLSVLGPAYMDGYKVLVSEYSNSPESLHYTDTLFKAAQMIGDPTSYSLDPDDYNFTEGYIHANGYTNPEYFFLAYIDNGGGGLIPFYNGKLEPHMVSLAEYAGKDIYIAFLHDSDQDFLLQIDDILVSNSPTVGLAEPGLITGFQTMPNPVQDDLYLQWTLQRPAICQLTVTDSRGAVVFNRTFDKQSGMQYHLEATSWPSGLYVATLRSEGGTVSRKLLKM